MRRLVIALLIPLSLSLQCAAMQAPSPPSAVRAKQSSASNASDNPEDLRLKKAQADYYEAEKARIDAERQKLADDKDKKKSFSDRFAPYSPFTAVIAALIAALVAILNSGLNYRATLKSQRTTEQYQQDSQFYEALKRFGDKDSPSVRASAAGLIAQMGASPAKGKPKQASYDYFHTAFAQLMVGLRLEENPAVVDSICSGLKTLAGVSPSSAFYLPMVEENRRLQGEFMETIARVFALDAPSGTEVDENAWETMSGISGFDLQTLRTLKAKFSDEYGSGLHAGRLFSKMLVEAQAARDSVILTRQARSQLNAKTRADLIRASERLRASSQAWGQVLSRFSPIHYGGSDLFLYAIRIGWGEIQQGDLSRLVAPNANISASAKGANLVKSDLHGAIISADFSGADLSYSDLAGADLTSANLAGTKLSGCNLTATRLPDGIRLDSTKMLGAKVDERTEFGHAILNASLGWVKADFSGIDFYDQRVIDRNLISILLTPVVTKLADLHKAEQSVAAEEQTLAKAQTLPETTQEEQEIKEIHVRLAQHGYEWSSQRLADTKSYRQKVIDTIADAHTSVKEFAASELPDLIAKPPV